MRSKSESPLNSLLRDILNSFSLDLKYQAYLNVYDLN